MWSLLIAAAAAGLAGALAFAAVRNPARKPVLFGAVMTVAFVGLNLAGRALVLPELRAWSASRQAEQIFEENRIFSLLASQHPEIREQITARIEETWRRGLSPEQTEAEVMARGRDLVGLYFEGYTPAASGESLVAFVRATVKILDALGQRDDDACYYWMFGGELPSGFSMSAAVSSGQQAEMFEAMADVVESAIQNPQPPQDRAQSQAAIERFGGRLIEEHGQEFTASLRMLQTPRAPGVDRKRVCEATVAFYGTALDSPDPTTLVRALFATQS